MPRLDSASSRRFPITMLTVCLLLPMLVCQATHAAEIAPPAPTVAKPSWAAEFGRDAAGDWATLVAGSETLRLRLIRAGSFDRNTAKPGSAEKTTHQVTLSHDYWLGDSEVTQGLWLQVMGANPSAFTGDASRPVEDVTWEDCRAFCARLNTRFPTLHAALPSEAQWEYACRAGSTSDPGDAVAALAWHAANAGGQTHAVRSLQANAWGLYDMLGNVWEWCDDIRGEYPAAAVSDPRGPTSGPYRISRGGSWSSGAAVCHPGQRGWDMPDVRGSDVGFRLAVTVKP